MRRTAGSPNCLRESTRCSSCFPVGWATVRWLGQLGVSVETVKTHIERLYKRLDVTTRTDAVAKALGAGIIG